MKQKYVRSQFIPAKGSFLEVDAVPEDNISLREAGRKASIVGGQGYRSCICVKGCESKHCRRACRPCNSKCHGSLSCKKSEVSRLAVQLHISLFTLYLQEFIHSPWRSDVEHISTSVLVNI